MIDDRKLEEIKDFAVNLYDLNPIGLNHIKDKIDPERTVTINKNRSDETIVLFRSVLRNYYSKGLIANYNRQVYAMCQFLSKMLGIRTYVSKDGVEFTQLDFKGEGA